MSEEVENRRRSRRRRNASDLGGSGGFSEAEGEARDVADGRNTLVSPPVDEPLSEYEDSARGINDAPFTPGSRAEEVKKSSRGTNYEREYRFTLLHRMIIRRVPQDQIAKELGLSVRQVQRDIKALYERLRKNASAFDTVEHVGDGVSYYREIQSMALRMASMNKLPAGTRLTAMRTALAARNDETRFLSTVGVYDAIPFEAGNNRGVTDIEKLMDMTERLLSGEEEEQAAEDILSDDEEKIRLF
jgi:hypothetical protein